MIIKEIVTANQAIVALSDDGTAFILVEDNITDPNKKLYRWEEILDDVAFETYKRNK